MARTQPAIAPSTPLLGSFRRRAFLAKCLTATGAAGLLASCGQGQAAQTSSTVSSVTASTVTSAVSTRRTAPTATPTVAPSARPSPSGSGVPATQVQVWSHLSIPAQRQTLTSLSAAFSKLHPEVTVQWTWTPGGSWDGLMQKVTAALAGNVPPDITYISPGRLDSLRRGGAVLALDAFIAKSPTVKLADFAKAALQAVTFAGKTWALPFSGNTGYYGFYNKDLFTAANIAAPPTSWDEIVSQAQKVTKTDSSGAMTQMGYEGAVADAYPWTYFLWGNGGKFWDRTGTIPKPVWDSPQGVEALQFLVDLIHKDQVWSITAPPSGGEKAGKVGMWFKSGPAVMATYEKIPGFHWGIFRAPGRSGPPPAAPRPADDNLNLYSTPRQEAAWPYLEFMTNTANLATWGGPPPRASSRATQTWLDFVKATPALTVVDQAADAAQPPIDIYGLSDVLPLLNTQHQMALQQKATPHDALAEAVRQATATLAKLYT